MRFERLCERTASNRMQDRSLDLEISPLVEEGPQLTHDHTSLHEDLTNFPIDHKIDITPSIANLDVG